MTTLFNRYSNRWQQLPARDRLALKLLSLFLAVTLFWTLLWSPQHQALREAEQQFQEALQLQTDLLKLPSSNNARSPQANSRTLASLITTSTAAANLSIERMDSEEAGRLNLNLGGALQDLLTWLDEVENQGVNLVSLQLEVDPQALVQARLTLESN
ncbi:type II secretion system protein GspM [Pseudomonas chlororaphis subsp. aurantiaca]|uniref:type II secretion system protein GspM n=1 Tax=Pseudomonas chlororaphis TaxID=587753 RepID=UPI0027DE9CA0|nr:type II secretion system protein GspM [Pseudomonas chlororaphis]WMI99011.1 type II secretion system protein GspM [Pseudomonas chlororaphis subsp. aurantiaca]